MRVTQPGTHSVPTGDSPAAKAGGRPGGPQESKDVKEARDAKEVKDVKHRASADVDKSGARGGAKAEISAKGKEFAQAKEIAAGAPEVRDERIAELKRRISEGTYKVDAEAVADRLVDDHLRMSDG